MCFPAFADSKPVVFTKQIIFPCLFSYIDCMRKLTSKQQNIFDFILDYYRDRGQVPDYPALQEEFGFSSSNSVYQLLQALVKKQCLVKLDHGRYDIHRTKLPLLDEGRTDDGGIPVRGRIAAGGMHEAIGEDLGRLPVEILSWRSPRLFALQVTGDSMIEAGIRDGDYIILDPRQPNNGDIGAILYNGETTLKRIYKKDGEIELRPENPAYDPINIRPQEWEEVTVFGTYIGKAWQDNEGWRLFFRT